MSAAPPKHFLQISDFSVEEFEHLIARTRWIKDRFKRYELYQPLRDRTLAMVFEKASTRTRVSFEAGMNQLGGIAINLNRMDTHLSRGEPIEDVARVISRMVDVVMIRTFEQTIIERFAAHSRVPVINGLTNEYHPCQILADIYTYIEHRGSIRGRTVAWVGDSNNVCHTWLQAAAIFDFALHVSTPPGYEMKPAQATATGRFEAAVDAVVDGDAAALRSLLTQHADLMRARSTRRTCFDPPVHAATLLHYVAANGVENHRQRTPGNALSPSTMRRRRRSNSPAIFATSSCGPLNASTAAHCATDEGFDVTWLWASVMARRASNMEQNCQG